ncbi:3-hexulose-6-phosphate synthase [Actinomycetospora chlora]|uniref:3-hexulose-6-phosphate synthase n=1 Tax=Actinomycetospora chlora TaxID=663608 RepID=A0ABP9A7C4_9PSEU
MKLQLALDVATLDEALVVSRAAAEYVDILELGSTLIKNEGTAAISAIKATHPGTTVLADMKTAEAGGLEAGLAFAAGADLVTVLDGADDDTIAAAVAVARSHGKGVVADMITARELVARAREVVRLGAEFCEIHAGPDGEAPRGWSIRAVIEAGRQSEVPFSVAGGVDLESIGDVARSGAVVAVVGTAVTAAPDPRAAARGLRVAVDTTIVGGEVPWVRQGRPHGIPSGPGPAPARPDRLADRAPSS